MMTFFHSCFFLMNREAVIKLLKDLCSKPGVDCTNLLTAFTGTTN